MAMLFIFFKVFLIGAFVILKVLFNEIMEGMWVAARVHAVITRSGLIFHPRVLFLS